MAAQSGRDIAGTVAFDDLYSSQQLARIYREMVTERVVLTDVARELELAVSPDTVAGWVDAQVVEGTPILEISATHPDPALAASLANTLAEVFIRYIQEQRLTEEARLQSMASSLGVADPGNILGQQLTALGSFTIIRQAAVPESPLPVRAGGGPGRQGLVLLVAGVLAALFFAFALEHLADRVRTPEKLKSLTGMEPLAVVPGWPRRKVGPHQPVSLALPKTRYAEAYREMMARLQVRWLEQAPGPVACVITSSAPYEGKTTTAVNLSIALAESGRRVVLVDADPWRRDIYRWFHLRSGAGLTDFITDPNRTIQSVLRATAVEHLRVITSGPVPRKPASSWARGAPSG